MNVNDERRAFKIKLIEKLWIFISSKYKSSLESNPGFNDVVLTEAIQKLILSMRKTTDLQFAGIRLLEIKAALLYLTAVDLKRCDLANYNSLLTLSFPPLPFFHRFLLLP